VPRDYVALTLEIGEREPGYVDAYYGPAQWAETAKAQPRALPQLAESAAALSRRLETLPTAGLDAQSRQRRAYLSAHVSAASARLRMLQGEKMGFADEAEAQFGVRPELRPLSSYDAVVGAALGDEGHGAEQGIDAHLDPALLLDEGLFQQGVVDVVAGITLVAAQIDGAVDGEGRLYDGYAFSGTEGQRVQAIMRSGDFDALLQVGKAGAVASEKPRASIR